MSPYVPPPRRDPFRGARNLADPLARLARKAWLQILDIDSELPGAGEVKGRQRIAELETMVAEMDSGLDAIRNAPSMRAASIRRVVISVRTFTQAVLDAARAVWAPAPGGRDG